MKRAVWIVMAGWLVGPCLAEPTSSEETPDNMPSILNTIRARAVVGLATVPYCVDLAWQLPFGSRVSWLTTTAANPDPQHAPAHVFLVRGSGSLFSPGFGELCTRLRQAGIWAEDLGSAGDRWICQHLRSEQRAGQLSRSVVLVGHSRGGRHVIDAACELQKADIVVDLLVCVDVALPPTVPGNVRQVLNVYTTQQWLYSPEPLRQSVGANTRIENLDLGDPRSPLNVPGLHHLNITANSLVQELIMERILKVASERSRDE
jgi:hypothetical protein